jgi:5-methylcytosine-specific restriction protein A
MSNDAPNVLATLRPESEAQIMDLVAAAGIDVSPWARKKDGAAVSNPRANPQYCYEWAFGGDGEPTALCVWHDSLTTRDRLIAFYGNTREDALSLDRVAIDPRNPAHVRSRARDQAKRARKFDSLLQRAFRKGEPIRAILLDGQRRGRDEPGWGSSVVRFRMLDSEPWYAWSYADTDGAYQLVRGVRPQITPAASSADVPPSAFVDQFSLPESPDKREATGLVYPRSQEVREAVLRRASGVCECCAAPGFRTANGAIYLETHHVIPLSQKGPDVTWNVVALCPNDHRRAHYASDRDAISEQLLAFLLERFPGAADALKSLRQSPEGLGA